MRKNLSKMLSRKKGKLEIESNPLLRCIQIFPRDDRMRVPDHWRWTVSSTQASLVASTANLTLTRYFNPKIQASSFKKIASSNFFHHRHVFINFYFLNNPQSY